MELQSVLILLSTDLYDIYHCCVCSEKIPNDGQRNCPKHVEFYSKIKFGEISSSSWFYCKKLLNTI